MSDERSNSERHSHAENPRVNAGKSGADETAGVWMKYAGMGIELAGLTLGAGAIGYFVDWYFASERSIGVAFGVLIGFSFGMFRFIQVALKSVQRN